jgi:hypothetical protein
MPILMSSPLRVDDVCGPLVFVTFVPVRSVDR